jgi:predicted nucleotidyltransferase
MLDDKTIQSAVARLAAAAAFPSQVILFGSYARGTAVEGSDIDLLAIEREIPNEADEYMRLRDALGRLAPGVGVDLLLCQEHEYASGARYPVTFCTEPGMKARCCMTPFVDEAKRLLRIAGRDYQTFTILRNHPEALKRLLGQLIGQKLFDISNHIGNVFVRKLFWLPMRRAVSNISQRCDSLLL